jgi:hypothetical protein
MGSGFIVGADGVILTNAHVVKDATDVVVKLTDRREFKAKVLGTDPKTDIAVLKINAANLPVVTLGSTENLRVGEWVLAIGAPFGFENTVTAGVVSAKGRSLPDDSAVPFIQTDVAVNPGNSGGPLFNARGEVVGINSQIYSQSGGYQGVSFAIPIDLASRIKDQIVAHGKVEHARLGVAVQEVNQSLADSFGLDKPEGALVSSVEKGSPADRAGLQGGRRDPRVNGRPSSLRATCRRRSACRAGRAGGAGSLAPGQEGAGDGQAGGDADEKVASAASAPTRRGRQAGPGAAPAAAGREARRPASATAWWSRTSAGPSDAPAFKRATWCWPSTARRCQTVEQMKRGGGEVRQVGGAPDPARRRQDLRADPHRLTAGRKRMKAPGKLPLVVVEERAAASGLSAHILPTSATMIGVCMTVMSIGHLGPRDDMRLLIDRLLAIDALVFLASALLSFISMRSRRSGARLEAWGEMVFIAGLGLLALGAVALAFALR